MPKVSIGRAELDTRPHLLYRFYDRTGVLLYIGITVDFGERQKHHAKYKDWWCEVDQDATKVEYYNGRRAALDAERLAIKAEKPLENDQHNEWVETGDDEEDEFDDPLYSFAMSTIAWLDAEEIGQVLREASRDEDGNEVDERTQNIAAANRAVLRLWKDRHNLARMVEQYLDLLPEGEGEYHLFQSRQDWRQIHQDRPGEPQPDTALALGALTSLARDRALTVLKSMSEEEAREWTASAVALGIEDSDEMLIFAARYATMVNHSPTSGFTKLCHGSGSHGARCPNQSTTRAFFEMCGSCEAPRSCKGHTYWCAAHASAIEAGSLSILESQQAALWPLSRIEPLPDDPWAVPF